MVRGNELMPNGYWDYFHAPMRLNVAFVVLSGKIGRITDKQLTQKHLYSHVISLNTLLASFVFMNRIAEMQIEHAEEKIAPVVT